jgi:PAS domain S-box-containing protein
LNTADTGQHAASRFPPVGWRDYVPALAVLLICLTLTGLLWHYENHSARARAQGEFDIQTRAFSHALETRLSLYRRALRGARALFAASTEVSRVEWHRYIDLIQLDEGLPGLQGLGYAAWLPSTARTRLEAQVQREGYRHFQAWPQTADDAFSTILYLEPEAGRNLRALGYDMYSEPIRREAMDATRDSGDAVMSGVVKLVQDSATSVNLPGFLLYLPVYRKGTVPRTVVARRNALQGWVYAVLRSQDLVAGLLAEQPDSPAFALRIGDEQPRSHPAAASVSNLYRSPSWPQRPQYTSSLEFEFSGRRWNIDFVSLPTFEAAHRQYSGLIILLSGGLLSLTLALMVELLVKGRRHAVKRAQTMTSKLVKSNELQRTMIKEVRDYAIILLDENACIASWNCGAQQLKGYHFDEVIGRHFSLFYPPDDIAAGKPERELAEVRASGRMEDEGWRVRRDGSRFWANVIITALHDERGNIQGYVKVTRDLTERMQAERQLQEANRLNRTILDSAAYAIIATDPAGTITVFNRAAERMLGYRADDMIGLQSPAIFHDAGEVVAHSAVLSAELHRPVEPGFETFVAKARLSIPDNAEWTYIAHDGTRIPVSLAVTALFDAHGGIDGFLGIAHDISERRQHDEMQQKSLREKEVLLQEVHHRVKNNLQVIYSLLDLQADTIDDDATLRLFRDAQARVHAMALIHQTLYQSNNFAAVDLGAYLLTLMNDFAASYVRPEICLVTDFGSVFLDVQSAVPCGLLISELLTNAYKHAFPNARSGTIRVTMQQTGDDVHLVVADNGVGLAPDAQTRGTLGLKLVRILAEQLHASMEYADDSGTRVSLNFHNKSQAGSQSGSTRQGVIT